MEDRLLGGARSREARAWPSAVGAGPVGKEPKRNLLKEYEVESSALDAEDPAAVRR